MKTKEIIKITRKIAGPFRVTKGESFRLQNVDPNDTLGFTKEEHKPAAKEALAMGVAALADLQDKLYAQERWAVLLIFQAMDAAGKDGAIKHVMSGVNPQGCQVFSFKAPSAEDLDHDYIGTSENSRALMKKSFHSSKRNLVRSLKLSVEGRPQNTLKWCERRIPVKAFVIFCHF